jgi:uncharacterized membrane protein YphA (DoxX/SURF4 family)
MDKNSGSSGIGLSGVLTIIFVVLKLVGVINWSWWWVLSPTLISFGLALLIIIGFAIYVAYDNKKYGLTSKKGKKDKWKF